MTWPSSLAARGDSDRLSSHRFRRGKQVGQSCSLPSCAPTTCACESSNSETKVVETPTQSWRFHRVVLVLSGVGGLPSRRGTETRRRRLGPWRAAGACRSRISPVKWVRYVCGVCANENRLASRLWNQPDGERGAHRQVSPVWSCQTFTNVRLPLALASYATSRNDW